TNQIATNNSSNFHFHENVADGFGMVVFNASNFHAMAGVRYDGAAVDVTGEQQQPNPPGAVVSGLANSALPVYRPIRTTSGYGNFLPAASFNYLPLQTVQLRGAISRTIGRPDYSDYAPNSAISQDPATGIVTITQGNPNLKPRLSTN